MNFLHVGFPKAASTLLQQHYFTSENNFHNLLDHGPHDWRRFIQHDLASAQSSFFQSTPPALPETEHPNVTFGLSNEAILDGPLDYSVVLARWKKIFPNSRVLIVIRSQPELVFSLFVQYVRVGYFRDIGQFTEELMWDAQQGPWGTLKFDRIFEITKEYFDEVKLIPFEWLVSDASLFFQELNLFFGRDVIVNAGRVRPSSSDIHLEIMRRLNSCFKHGLGLRVMHPQPGYVTGEGRDIVNQIDSPSINERSIRRRKTIRIWSYRLASGAEFLIPSTKTKRMRSDYLERYRGLFVKTFGQSNDNLSKIVGIDLASLGYPMLE
tara:strand:+ start:278 stop:1246 length:969 start_codon:yes stop_codon:yes gene_type:complete